VNQIYLDTARLLIQVAPLVFTDNIFALKGGTAINLFVRDMPRLSVDLDLVFVDHRLERDKALARINEAIRGAIERLKKHGFQTYAGHSGRRRRNETFRSVARAGLTTSHQPNSRARRIISLQASSPGSRTQTRIFRKNRDGATRVVGPNRSVEEATIAEAMW
jgi:predicted nucleotidyltransferase component of viral defense system